MIDFKEYAREKSNKHIKKLLRTTEIDNCPSINIELHGKLLFIENTINSALFWWKIKNCLFRYCRVEIYGHNYPRESSMSTLINIDIMNNKLVEDWLKYEEIKKLLIQKFEKLKYPIKKITYKELNYSSKKYSDIILFGEIDIKGRTFLFTIHQFYHVTDI